MAQDEVSGFFANVEETFGGPVEFKTFSFFSRVDGEQVVTTSGLLCIVNGILYFEDFEKSQGAFMGLLGAKRSPYKKFKAYRPISEIKSCTMVSASTASAFLEGRVKRDSLTEPRGLQKLMGKLKMHIAFKEYGDWIIEPLDAKQLMKALEEHR